MWQQWVNGVIGLLVLVFAFTGLSGDAYTWTLAITGIAVAILGFWGATEHKTMMEGHGRMATH